MGNRDGGNTLKDKEEVRCFFKNHVAEKAGKVIHLSIGHSSLSRNSIWNETLNEIYIHYW